MGKIFKNAPLIEAAFEVRFPAELSIENKRAEFHDEIKKEFPNIFVPIVHSGESPSLKPYEFKDTDSKKIIRFSINSFSFHAQDYSGGFEKFERECLRYVGLFLKYFKITILNRTGLRYVNHIPIIRNEGVIPIKDYLNFGFELPSSISSNPKLFHTVVISRVGDGSLRTLIQSQEVMPNKNEIIILDFDYYYEGNLKADNFPDYLCKSHQHIKEDVFTKLISEKYLKLLEKD